MRHPPHAESRSIALALTTYTVLLRLYPATFQQRFAREMTQVFRASCREAWQQHRGWGVLTLWLMTLPDVVWTAGQERFARREGRQGVFMSAKLWIRLGGIMAFVTIGCDFLLELNALRFDSASHTRVFVGLNFAGQIALLCVGLGLLAAQRGLWGRWLWGIAVICDLLAALLYNVAAFDPNLVHFGVTYRLVLSIFQLLALLSGFVASIITWRTRSLGRWSPLPCLAFCWLFVERIIDVVSLRLIVHAASFGTPGQSSIITAIFFSLPLWLSLMGIGVGLMQMGGAMRPSDAVQLRKDDLLSQLEE